MIIKDTCIFNCVFEFTLFIFFSICFFLKFFFFNVWRSWNSPIVFTPPSGSCFYCIHPNVVFYVILCLNEDHCPLSGEHPPNRQCPASEHWQEALPSVLTQQPGSPVGHMEHSWGKALPRLQHSWKQLITEQWAGICCSGIVRPQLSLPLGLILGFKIHVRSISTGKC